MQKKSHFLFTVEREYFIQRLKNLLEFTHYYNNIIEKNRIFAFELCALAETNNHFEEKIITALMLLKKSGNQGNSQDI